MQPVLPEVEELIVAFLTEHPALAPLHGGRVGTDLTDLPGIRVTRVGGQPGWYEDRARISTESWAPAATEASLLARTLVACLPDIVTADGHVRGFGEVSGPISRHHPDEGHQYLVDFTIYAYS